FRTYVLCSIQPCPLAWLHRARRTRQKLQMALHIHALPAYSDSEQGHRAMVAVRRVPAQLEGAGRVGGRLLRIRGPALSDHMVMAATRVVDAAHFHGARSCTRRGLQMQTRSTGYSVDVLIRREPPTGPVFLLIPCHPAALSHV